MRSPKPLNAPRAILDRQGLRRKDDAYLGAAYDDPATRLVALWRGRPLLREGRPAPLTVGTHGHLLERASAQVFMGEAEGARWLALELDGDVDPASFELGESGRFEDLRVAGAALPWPVLEPLLYARGMLRWHRAARHCESCGSDALRSVDAGFAKECTHCGARTFPRTDPAVMILVTRGDQALLARQPRWPRGMVSALAGFVEPGESLEQCVVRETLEEVGLEVETPVYVGSQPWPFPRSLMLAFRCEAREGDVSLDDDELEEARWFSREELRAPKGFFVPPPISLAHRLIRAFAEE
ncbi:MAG: NAD(+) diphosphatase [Myxococcota bacterium]